MRIRFVLAALAALSAGATLVPAAVSANPIEQACRQSGRAEASSVLCGCIGAAAGMTLSQSDMREGARLFRDPGRAEEVQLSDRPRDDAFWSRWQQFAETAEALCS